MHECPIIVGHTVAFVDEGAAPAGLYLANGHLTRIVAADVGHQQIFDSQEYSDADETPGALFCAWLLDNYPYDPDKPCPWRLFGFDARAMLLLAAIEAGDRGLIPPLLAWGEMGVTTDAYEWLQIRAGPTGGSTLAAVLKRKGMVLADNYKPHIDAFADAMLTAEILRRYGLVPPECNADLAKMIAEKLRSSEEPATVEEEKKKEEDRPKKHKKQKAET